MGKGMQGGPSYSLTSYSSVPFYPCYPWPNDTVVLGLSVCGYLVCLSIFVNYIFYLKFREGVKLQA